MAMGLIACSDIQSHSQAPPTETVSANAVTQSPSDGVLIDRAIGYAATDGTTLYVIVTGVISQDPSGSFSNDEQRSEQFF